MTKSVLKHEGDSDYVLESDSVWIEVKGFSVYLKKTDEGVSVSVYDSKSAMDDCITETYAYDNELLEE